MTGILAIDTSSDTCSVALKTASGVKQRFCLAPRQHSRLLFELLEELVPAGRLDKFDVDVLAFAQGPGSFTGLRIAASAVQALAYASGLPVVGVSTLLCQAQHALRLELVEQNACVLSTLDARVGEIYWSLVSFANGVAREIVAPGVCTPDQLTLPESTGKFVAVGSGLSYWDSFPPHTRRSITKRFSEAGPMAQDLLPAAKLLFDKGQTLSVDEVLPVYVRKEINWKKLPEQGKAQ